jgi:hypothetical protein
MSRERLKPEQTVDRSEAEQFRVTHQDGVGNSEEVSQSVDIACGQRCDLFNRAASRQAFAVVPGCDDLQAAEHVVRKADCEDFRVDEQQRLGACKILTDAVGEIVGREIACT